MLPVAFLGSFFPCHSLYYPHFPQRDDDTKSPLSEHPISKSEAPHRVPPQTTCTVAAAALQVPPGSEFLSGRRRWHIAALPGPPGDQPRPRTEVKTASQSHGCTKTQKTGDGHCCTQPTETQSQQA